MNTSKHASLLLIPILSFTLNLFSQQIGNRQGQRQQQQQQQQQQRQGMVKKELLSPQEMTEIIFYEADVVIKKIKLKDKVKKKLISDAIDLYNNKLTEIKGFGFLEFNAAKKLIKNSKELATLNNDPQLMKDTQKKLRIILLPIRKKVIVQQNLLEAVVKKELTTKQYSKWLKYKKSKIFALKPKSKEKQQMQVQRGQGYQGKNYSRRRF